MGDWQPNLDDCYQKIPRHGLLRQGIDILYRKKIVTHPLETLRDSHGEYAKRYGHFVYCAKKYIYGYIVSCHTEILAKAIERKIPVLMFLGSYINKKSGEATELFYEFNPEEVLKESEINHKGKAEMRNFNIRLGKRFEVN